MQGLGGSTARQIAKVANGNIPYHRHHTQFMNRGWRGGRNAFFFSFLRVRILSCLGLQTFLGVSSFLGVLQNLQYLRGLGSVIAAQGLATTQTSDGDKIALCIDYFVYSLLSLLLLLIVVVVVFCCLIKLSLSQPTSFTFCLFLLPIL